ncbi:MAG: SGNH/GDSL hydrolase family protein [Planctomycetaceae bacterium]|nr:SGNH/GDSL hydrolase family protein [Planctomycetaceae bacterium]
MRVRSALYRTLPALILLAAVASLYAEPAFPLRAKRILFLGDSITHGGGYVAYIETQLRLLGVDPLPEIINIGLSSETCSGLSEPGHPFPRPDVHERLDRALAAVQPDVVVACYGMNDGIYHPLNEERFAAYRDGVRLLIDKVHATGAKLVLLTPPPFDPIPLEAKGKLQPAGQEVYGYTGMYAGYDEVLTRYAQWIMQELEGVEMVVDVHAAVAKYVADQRRENPAFSVSPDGIHPNADGHRVMAQAVLTAWGVIDVSEPDPELLKLITQKTHLLHDAWLSHVGHQRPGVKAGLPLPEAQQKAQELETKIARRIEE